MIFWLYLRGTFAEMMRETRVMRYKKQIILIIFMLCACFSSFVFGKSKTELEIDKIIATHEEIKKYDDELNDCYQRLHRVYAGEEWKQLQREQKSWLQERNTYVSDPAIVEKKYKERLGVLKELLYKEIFTPEYAQSKGLTEPKEKIYPPYPDVWGYDLSEYPAFKWGGGGIHAYRMEDGDVWFIMPVEYKKNIKWDSHSYKEIYSDEKYVLIKFFKQERIELTKEDKTKLLNTLSKSIGYDDSFIKFKSGETLEIYSHPLPKLCFVPDFISHYLIKTSPEGKKKTTILAASPQVEIWRDNARCEMQGAPFLYQKLYFLPGYLVGLEDDTFLTFSTGANLILRFDKDLKTRFQPQTPVFIQGDYINRNFFVLDYSVIEELQNKYISESVPLFQTIHDALSVHFHEKFNYSNKENNNDD